jgi:hypothetical protein
MDDIVEALISEGSSTFLESLIVCCGIAKHIVTNSIHAAHDHVPLNF